MSVSWLRVNENRKSNQQFSVHGLLVATRSAFLLYTHDLFQAEHVRKIMGPLNVLKNMCRYSVSQVYPDTSEDNKEG